MACPITKACYVDLSDIFKERSYLYDDLIEKWVAVGSEISRSMPSEQALRLRGFYAVEAMLKLLREPSLRISAIEDGTTQMMADRIAKFMTSSYPRSTEGLNKLIEDCRRGYRGLTVDQGELSLVCDTEGVTAWKLICSHIEGPKAVLVSCAEAAGILRARLGGGTRGIGKIGHIYATALITTNRSMEECHSVLSTLLRIDINNAVSPFNHVDI